MSEDLDEAFRNIEQPNVNSGWAALSPDGKTIVWSVADVIELPVSRMLVSQDRGKTFRIAEVYQADGTKKSQEMSKSFLTVWTAACFTDSGIIRISMSAGTAV